MQILRNGIVASAASLLLFGAVALAQMTPPPTATSNAKTAQMGDENKTSSTMAGVSGPDRSFMNRAAQGGMAEVELGQLAQQNAQSQEVKDFGKRMVDDHSKANDELKQLASQKGVSLPTELDKKDQALKDRLSKLNGEAFDKAYMNDMVKDHKKDVAEFKHESTAAEDPQLKAWASKTLPTLEDHLKQAEQIAPKERAEAKGEKKGKSEPTTMAQPQ